MGQSVSRRQLRAGQKGGDGVGRTKRGKGTKVMLVVEGNGLPIGFCLVHDQATSREMDRCS